jgi:tRNA pseudouridine32 synthase/23S rRNA pseudouridine746 synthase
MADLSDWQCLHADDDLLVVDKPAGMLSVPGRGPDKQDCLLARVQQRYPQALVVHRLDQATSGLMLFALNPETQRLLSMAFEARQVEKTYMAWVEGLLPVREDWQTIDLPIQADWERRPLRIIAPAGQASQTRWRYIAHHAEGTGSFLELQPLTGRTHQLRVHLQAIGHPIWGDALYAPAAVQARSPRLMLHAHTLSFTHQLIGVRFQLPVNWGQIPINRHCEELSSYA